MEQLDEENHHDIHDEWLGRPEVRQQMREVCLSLMTDATVCMLQTCWHMLAVDACTHLFAQSDQITASRLHHDMRLMLMHRFFAFLTTSHCPMTEHIATLLDSTMAATRVWPYDCEKDTMHLDYVEWEVDELALCWWCRWGAWEQKTVSMAQTLTLSLTQSWATQTVALIKKL